jgi:hypothetical protein
MSLINYLVQKMSMDDVAATRHLGRMRTDLMHEVVLVGVAALAIGCGSGPISGDDEIGDTGETDETGDGDGDESETDVGDTETDDAETDTDGETETGDGDGDAECITAQGTLGPRALRLEQGEDRAWIIGGDGEVELELEGPPADDTLWMVAAESDTTIALARNIGEFGQGQQTTVHAYDHQSGALEWTTTIGAGTSQLWVSDEGWVTAALNFDEPGVLVGYAVSSDQSLTFPDHQPMAAAADGWVTAREITAQGTYGQPGWIALADQSWTPVEPPAADPYLAQVADDLTIEYVAEGGNGPAFIRATPDGNQVIDLPNAQLPSDNVAQVGSAGQWRLLQVHDPNDQSSVLLRVDVEAGVAELIDPEPPPGWEWFDCYSRGTAIDPDGVVFFELRDAAQARAWAFDPETAQWSEVGQAIGTVDDIEFVGHFGSLHALRSAAQFTTFCPQVEWDEPPPEALVGDTLQLLRRLPTPLAVTLPTVEPWTARADESGSCVAYVAQGGWQVMAIETEQVLEFEEPNGNWLWLD